MTTLHRRLAAVGTSLGLMALLAGGALATNGSSMHQPHRLTNSQLELRQDMRKLWEDHITWTRVYIIANLSNAPDQSAAAVRLLQNQDDLGTLFGQYYGTENGDHLASLLRTHILTAVDVINAAKANDQPALDAANAAWYANAEDIAQFLHGLNPDQWPLATLESMMENHLDLTANEVVDRLHGDYTADVHDYDAVHDEILMMSDALSTGIIAQHWQSFLK